MIKKILSLIIILLACTFVVSAANNGNGDSSGNTGLDNAINRVQNEETKQKLEQIQDKLSEQNRNRLNQLEQLELKQKVMNRYSASGVKEDKLFGLFRIMHRYNYEISDEGSMNRVRSWHDNFWKEI